MNTSDINRLPAHADAKQYQQEAALLAIAFRSGDPAAVERIQNYHSLLGKQADPVITDATFDEDHAQQVIAREFGFADWKKFVAFIEEMQKQDSPVAQFETAVDAVIAGDTTTLRSLLLENPGLTKARSMRVHEATLLHYTAANGIENYRQKTPPAIVAIAAMLLEAGAEVDAAFPGYSGDGATLGLVATSVHPARAGVQLALLQLLFDHGASIDGLPGGWQPMMAAVANARPEAVEWLAGHGAKMSVVAAAALGRIDLVKKFFHADGSLKDEAPAWGVPGDPAARLLKAFIYACIYGHTAIAAFLAARGADPAAQDNDQYTGLHWAAHGGHLDTMNWLLEQKVPLEIKNCYGGTVLGQALWSAANHAGGWGGNKPGFDYLPVIERLLAAGAKAEPHWVTGIERIDEALRRHRMGS